METLQEFVAFCQDVVDTKGIQTPFKKTLVVEKGRKYHKIVCTDVSSRSVFGFVDVESGDILKAATWKAPAKGARGNLYQPETWASAVTPYGMAYR
jgi:hypothetical protein